MNKFDPIPGAKYKHDYVEIFRSIDAGQLKAVPTYRKLCKVDLFFLLYFGLGREDVNKPFVVDCIREVEDRHDDTLDLWAREHYKSTIITYGLPFQELINDPEHRICIFSHTRPIAKGFLRQIKQTLEGHVPVKKWFPDVFWLNPRRQALKWSEDDGLIIRRKTNPKEASIEAWGLVDGQPISKHFSVRIYDDVVTEDSVTETMIPKTQKAYELSQSLGTDGGSKRMVGTHYHFADLYSTYKKKGIYKTRVKPATHDGTPTGNPVFLSRQRLNELLREQGSYIFACQQLLNPVATEDQVFKLDWLKYYHTLPIPMNKYLLCDPANEKKKSSDSTAMGVVGLDAFGNYLLLDLLKDKLNLTERWTALKTMWKNNLPIVSVGYEKYGKDSDIAYFEEKQKDEGIYFGIEPLGGQLAKPDRIKRLVPIFENHRFLLPAEGIIYKNQDMVRTFIDEEYYSFPFCVHDDILDMLARIEDPKFGASRPMIQRNPGRTQEMAETQYAALG